MTIFESAARRKAEIAEEARLKELNIAKAKQEKQAQLNQFILDCQRVGHELAQFPGCSVETTLRGFIVRCDRVSIQRELWCEWTKKQGGEGEGNRFETWFEPAYCLSGTTTQSSCRGGTILKLREDLTDFAAKYLL
jgi:hypothetical protein